MASKKEVFLALLQQFAPAMIAAVNPKLAPLATDLAQGMTEAEDMVGANGPQKLQHVINIGVLSADAINASQKKIVIDKTQLQSAIANSVSGVVTALNSLHKVSTNQPV